MKTDIILGEFKCTNESKYILKIKVCDSIIDSEFGSDEKYCKNRESKLAEIILYKKEILPLTVRLKKIEQNIVDDKLPDNIKKLNLRGNISFSHSIESFTLSIFMIEGNHFLNQSFFFPNLFFLSITKSMFKNFNFIKSENMSLLKYLNISFNTFSYLNFFKRVNCSNLLTLYISYSNIEQFTHQTFRLLKNLEKLFLNLPFL